ncbi:MAG: hypothetical protein IPI04_11620 [Ignavibacteria bacterium]|nr:hypothetical protein [Ignavibacteria bacterium]MBK8380608.1 hypothetical protein [Ignavibacteria bacterium]MBK9406029.1 hypothetical protein [Ignavibacteria bacterium]
MDAIRQKIKRTGNKLIIDLPDEFKSEMFELILLPIENNTNESDDQLNEWSDFSLRNLETFYNKDEPDYTNVKIKEPNEKYKP